ncbi:MAG: hypothetical protein AAGA90_07030 [Actinomycetota bacterium]
MSRERKGSFGVISPDPDAIERWLFGFIRPDAPRGFAAWRAAESFFAALGNPQDRVRAVHVVGTAGKGTVAQLIARELRRRGITVGLHLSPHVHDVRERFTVADELPSWEEVAEAAAEIQAVIDEGHDPTFFAVTTALALVLARRAATEVLVVEAGIGGRHDATNTFHRRDVITAVTAIGLDHQDVLGPTIEQIAFEKTAVLRDRDWAVVGPQADPVAARKVRAAGRVYGTRLVDIVATGDWRDDAAATARGVLRWFLPDVGALEPLDQPGRYEVHEVEGRRWIFDGAHNPMKLTALAGTLADDPEPRFGIVAIGAGKDLRGCASAVADVLDAAVVVAFGPPEGEHGPQSHPVETMEQALRRAGIREVAIAEHPEAAVAAAERSGAPTIVVTGSFLHLTLVREALLGA